MLATEGKSSLDFHGMQLEINRYSRDDREQCNRGNFVVMAFRQQMQFLTCLPAFAKHHIKHFVR